MQDSTIGSTDTDPTKFRSPRTKSRPWWRLGILLLVTVAATYLAASYWLGGYAQQQIERYARQSKSLAPVDVVVLHHQRGLLQSSGILQISASLPSAPVVDQAAMPTVLQVSYQLNHAIWPTRMAELTWQAQVMSPQSLAARESTWSEQAVLHGDGQVDWHSQYDGSLSMQAWEQSLGDSRIVFSDMQGAMHFSSNQQRIQARWPVIELDEGVQVSAFNQVQWRFEADRQASSHQFEIGRAVLPSADMQMHGVSFVIRHGLHDYMAAANGSAHTTVVRLEAKVEGFALGRYHANAVVMDGTLQGLSPDSVRALGAAWLYEFGGLTHGPVQDRAHQMAMRQLVMEGFEAKIQHLSARSDWGNLQGQASLVVRPIPVSVQLETERPIPWDTYLSSSAEVLLQGLSPSLAGLGLLTGVLVRTPDGVVSRYVLEDGRVTLNGKSAPAFVARPVLLWVYRWLNRLTQIDVQQA